MKPIAEQREFLVQDEPNGAPYEVAIVKGYVELLAWAERARKHLDDLRALYADALIGDFDDTESGSHEDFQEVLKLLSDLPTDTVTQSTQPGNVSIKSEDLDK